MKKWELCHVIKHLIKYFLVLTAYWVNPKIIYFTSVLPMSRTPLPICHLDHLCHLKNLSVTCVTYVTSVTCVTFTPCVTPVRSVSPLSPICDLWHLSYLFHPIHLTLVVHSGDHGQNPRRRRVCLYWGRLEVCCHGGMTLNINI